MPQTANEKLLDAATRHQLGLLRLSASTREKVLALIGRVNDDALRQLAQNDLTVFQRQRLEQLLQSLTGTYRASQGELFETLRAELGDLAEYELDFNRRVLERAVPIQWTFAEPAANQVLAGALAQPMRGRLLRDWATGEDGLMSQHAKKVAEAVRIGFVEGETNSQIISRARDQLPRVRRQAEALVRTATNHTATFARERLAEQNDDIIKGIKYVATLDSRTTPICASLDGKVFKQGQGPRPPQHWGCRSGTSYVTYSWRELGVDADELSPGARASMNGQVPAETTFGSWLENQSKETQSEFFGSPTRVKLFREGNLSISKFINNRGEFWDISELRRREARLFEELGL